MRRGDAKGPRPKSRPPHTDAAEERERRKIVEALADAVVNDADFQQWWAIRLNRRKPRPILVLPADHWYPGTAGTYLWDFHVAGPLGAAEQTELLAAMVRILHTTLDTLGMSILEVMVSTAPGWEDIPKALAFFSLPVSPRERQRRLKARRASEWWHGLQWQTWDTVETAIKANQPLPPCPFCGTRIILQERSEAGMFDIHCEMSNCFQLGIGPSRNLLPKIRQILGSSAPESHLS
jgi:hypothetical protein